MKLFLLAPILFALSMSYAQQKHPIEQIKKEKVITGAERLQVYFPMLKGKRLGVFANPGSVVGNTHLVDTLVKLGAQIAVIFGPEHGFRGNADAGDKVGNYTDPQTGIPVVSLYGSKQRPSEEDLEKVDILIYDIQDVGVRFYTYISSLEEFINAAFELGKPLLILDRPDPNGFYVDGPVLDKEFRSFVGMQPIPVVYGMTPGEYAMMLSGEKWLSKKANDRSGYYATAKNSPPDTPFHFLVIKCQNYTHNTIYELPVRPSPNLPEMQSVYWYPSTCFFEGTALSEGRGTEKPFQIFGHPSLPKNLYKFRPQSRSGATEPKWKDQDCYGWDLSGPVPQVLKKINHQIQLSYLLKAYQLFPDKAHFFLKPAKAGTDPRKFMFNKLAGNGQLMDQIIAGKSEKEIRKSWEPQLEAFKKIRKKYLLYPDFDPAR